MTHKDAWRWIEARERSRCAQIIRALEADLVRRAEMIKFTDRLAWNVLMEIRTEIHSALVDIEEPEVVQLD